MNTIFLRRVNIGQDATSKVIEGQTVIEFSVADNKKYKDGKGNKQEITTWFRCSYWTNVQVTQYLVRGASVNIIGTLSAGAYLNKQGQPVADLKITVKELDLLDCKEEKQKSAPEPVFENENDEFQDLPSTGVPKTMRPTKSNNHDDDEPPF
ncbi:MAG: single-stranded DNA-binding protein [Bacteroidota bacterium]